MPSFIYNGENIEYILSRNAKKNVNFRVKPNGEICISAPRRVSKIELDKMIKEKSKWLYENRNKVLNRNKNKIKNECINGSTIFFRGKKYFVKIISGDFNQVYLNYNFIIIQIKTTFLNNQKYINSYFDSWLKKFMYDLCDNLIDKYLNKLKIYKLKKPELTIRIMSSRWGSCMPSKCKITINQKLIYAPPECLEYVVLHEVSHLIEANHSKSFYSIVESIMPDWKGRRNSLNNF